MCWRGAKLSQWQQEFIRRAAAHDFPIFEPYYNLTPAQRDLLWHGGPGMAWEEGDVDVCIDGFFQALEQGAYKIQNRVMLARYRGKAECPVCHGTRLRPEALYVRVGDRTIADLVRLSVADLAEWFNTLTLSEHDATVAQRLLIEIRSRLRFLNEVGLGYLTLDRLSNSLSGGESQRINLATRSAAAWWVVSTSSTNPPSGCTLATPIASFACCANSAMWATPSLWSNTTKTSSAPPTTSSTSARKPAVSAAKWCGRARWRPPMRRTIRQTESRSHTLNFLTGAEAIPVPASRRRWNRFIDVVGARENNLRGIDVRFPLNVLTVVTGVSGSGKSTLVRDIFYKALLRHLDQSGDRPGEHADLTGDLDAVQAVDFIDQNPIGRSTRSNPVTYVKAFDEIRKLMAEQPLARQMEMDAKFFSFNTDAAAAKSARAKAR